MSPRTNKQFKEIREEKKALIMQVALELFANDGLITPISKIAREAGISKGLMYNYFQSKEELIKEIVLSGFDDIINLFDTNNDGVLTDSEFIFFIDQIFDLVGSNIQYWKLYFAIAVQPKVLEIIQDDLMAILPSLTKTMAGFFKSKGSKDPEMDAMFFNATLDGVIMNYVANPSFFDIDKLKTKIINLFTRNITS